MEIRDAKPSDAEAVRAVHSNAIRGLGTEAYTEEQVNAWARGCESADYTSAIESAELAFVVAEVDSEVVAFGSLKSVSPDACEADPDTEVTGVYVHPSVARNGIGTRIYLELEQRTRAQDVQTLGLSASLNAVPFYEKHGYERVREYAHEFSSRESTGMTGVIVEMKKEL